MALRLIFADRFSGRWRRTGRQVRGRRRSDLIDPAPLRTNLGQVWASYGWMFRSGTGSCSGWVRQQQCALWSKMIGKPGELGDVTVGDILARGGDSVGAPCRHCGHVWQAPIIVMPEATSLRKLQGLMRCPTCTSLKVEVAPEWPEDPGNLN